MAAARFALPKGVPPDDVSVKGGLAAMTRLAY